ncbi:hypothetical protein H8356DRAFT_1336553 [Neocallimastix lanati (nom. inval.)]|nr:hypothetical protein H8356DRAFT_1336553 [Neocallimastix sp. JGI-2020a]
MYLNFELYDNRDLENNSVLISQKHELVDNTTVYTLDPQLPCSLIIKFIQDTLTVVYNMTGDYDIANSDIIKKNDFSKYSKSKIKLFTSQKEKDFDLKEEECSLNEYSLVTHEILVEISYTHLISLLPPRNLNLSYENKVLVREGILLGVINDNNQSQLLNGIYNYGNNFYLKFIWDVQRRVHEYNLLHLISNSVDGFIKELNNEAYIIPNVNIDSIIVNHLKNKRTTEQVMNIKSYVHYRDIFLSLNNHLTNIIDSGSKESIDNIIQSLMSVGIQILLPNCYSKNSYFNGLLSKEFALEL